MKPNMKMFDSMKHYLLAGLFAILALSACSKDPFDDDKEQPHEPVKVEGTVYFASAIPQDIDSALRESLGNITSDADQARIIIVKSSDLSMYDKLLMKAWNEGKIIVEVEPEHDSHAAFWSKCNAPLLLLPSEKTAPLLIGVCGYSSFCLHNPAALDEYLADIEIEEDESATASDENLEENVGLEDIEVDARFLNKRMTSFFDWINENSRSEEPSNASGYAEFNGILSDFISDQKFTQRMTMTFPVGADKYKLCKIGSSKPDYISRESEINVTITITPLYAYEENGKDSGDYYFVTISVVSKNGALFDTYKKKHGAIWTYAHAFYSEDIAWTADITNLKSDNTVDFLYNNRPSPGPTSGSSSYTSSQSSTLNITGQGGAAGGKPTGTLTVGGSFSWSNSVSKNMTDMIIDQQTDKSKVEYHYMCVNFAQNDNVNKAVPLLARGDQDCLSSWCWHVTGLSDDDSSTKFKFSFNLDPLYGYMYRHTSWWAEGHYRHNIHLLPENNRTWTFEITPPDRRQMGILDFMCTTSDSTYVSNVWVLDSAGVAVDSALAAYPKNEHLSFQIPVGTYKLTYDIMHGQTGDKKNYSITGIDIKNAKTTYKQSTVKQ